MAWCWFNATESKPQNVSSNSKPKMCENFLSKEKLNYGEIIFFILYSFITIILLFVIDIINNKELAKFLLLFYSYGTIFFLYIFGYKSLRKLYFTQIFILIGLIHIVIFMFIKNNTDLYFIRGHSGKGLNYTILALILFQILRYISLKIQQKELVCPDRSGIDMFDNRKTNFFDFIFFLFYMLAIIGFIILTSV